MELTRLTFDQFSNKIKQERRKYFARNPVETLSVSMENEIVLDTTMNLEMIALAGTAFVAATETNVGMMNKQIEKL